MKTAIVSLMILFAPVVSNAGVLSCARDMLGQIKSYFYKTEGVYTCTADPDSEIFKNMVVPAILPTGVGTERDWKKQTDFTPLQWGEAFVRKIDGSPDGFFYLLFNGKPVARVGNYPELNSMVADPISPGAIVSTAIMSSNGKYQTHIELKLAAAMQSQITCRWVFR